jgi:hypothetical protein
MFRVRRFGCAGLAVTALAGCVEQRTVTEPLEATFTPYQDEAVPSKDGTATDPSRVERSGGHGYGSGNQLTLRRHGSV